MPGELSDPTQLFPFYYEPRYEPGTNPFPTGPFNLNSYIQNIAPGILGRRLNYKEMLELFAHLDKKGLLNRNPGDEEFVREMETYLNSISMSRKVACKWLSLIH